MLHAIIEKLSDYPGFFLFCRGILEANFTVIRSTIRDRLANAPGQKVLDVACGPGAFSDLFSPDCYTGIDLNQRYIDYAKHHYQGSFAVQDARELRFEEKSFDEALIYGLLHHLDDEDVTAVLSSLKRVLRPGGRVLIIEDIPTESRLNIVGHLLHWVENGHFIRPAEHYRRLLKPIFRIENEELFRSGVCDYYMADVTLDADASGEGSPQG